MKLSHLFATSILMLVISSCGGAVPEAATATPIPTPTTAPTATPVKYQVIFQITDPEGNPVEAAQVSADAADENLTTDSNGSVALEDLDSDTINVEVMAQGYLSINMEYTLEPGTYEITLQLESDPFGLLPAEVVSEGEELVYLEDFQDGEETFGDLVGDWTIVEDNENAGNLVLQIDQNGSENIANANFTSDQGYENFTINYRYRYVEMTRKHDDFASLTFRQDYNLSNDPSWANMEIIDLSNWTFPLQISKSFIDGQWYAVTLKVEGEQVWVEVDGKMLGRANYIEIRPIHWRFSVGVNAGIVQFDDILITTPAE